MFELSFVEILLIAVVGLLVIGPQDLPKVFKTLMGLFKQMQSAVSDVKSQMNEAMDESGVGDIQKQLKQEQQYIVDQYGNYQEVFDVSELEEIDSSKKEKPVSDE